jgi:hypothetical protein
MFVLLSLIVCLAGQPAICETVIPDYVHQHAGQSPTLFECLGIGGQDIARKWLAEHPGYLLRSVKCSVAGDPEALRERIESPRA